MVVTGFEGALQSLGVLGIGGVITATVTAIINRRKLGADTNKTDAEAAQVVAAAAGDLVQAIRTELTAVRTELTAAKDDRVRWEAERRGWYRRAEIHAEWDRQRIRENPSLPDCPPLLPIGVE